ncbi:hypothetical protein ULMS_14440 [Patiriisocius marinistellae]|uniref:Uncharacterized protein n=2 Tax=Patiriisocius marinistellae TaxID=2494560 RepID=A0A5J4G0E0_9FLAO|nr:hypothetical protein ULMS_14440 [Patiriisocius marinistellae]
MDINTTPNNFEVSNFRNISNNPGYNSQPSFADNENLLFAGTQNGQTEIMQFAINLKEKKRINMPTNGGEYSPQKFPKSNKIAAVRLDTTGVQGLYAYDYDNLENGKNKLLLPNVEVAYFAFHDNARIIASELGGNQLNLIIANLETNLVENYISNSGRSIHNVPNSNSVSYTLINEDKNHDIYLLDIDGDKESYFVCQLPVGIQDHCWLSETKLVLGSGSKLYEYNLFGNQEWKEVADLSSFNISEITRIAVSPNGKRLALVAETKQ